MPGPVISRGGFLHGNPTRKILRALNHVPHGPTLTSTTSEAGMPYANGREEALHAR